MESTRGGGWWAWTALHSHCKASLARRDGQALAEITMMIIHVAKIPAKTKKFALGLGERQGVTEVIGERAPGQHLRSILTDLIGKEAPLQCRLQESTGTTYEERKNRGLQFVNATVARNHADRTCLSKLGGGRSSQGGKSSGGSRPPVEDEEDLE